MEEFIRSLRGFLKGDDSIAEARERGPPAGEMKESYVLDASALIDFFEAGPGMRKVEQLLQAGARKQTAILVSVMNLGEVFYWTWQKRGEGLARKAVDGLSSLPIDIVAVNLPQRSRREKSRRSTTFLTLTAWQRHWLP